MINIRVVVLLTYHLSIIGWQIPGIIYLVVSKAPRYHLTNIVEVKVPVALSRSAD